jgi:hypothetical protein
MVSTRQATAGNGAASAQIEKHLFAAEAPNPMDNVLRVHEEIYECFHRSTIERVSLFGSGNEDTFAANYTSMFLIQDTGEAVFAHMEDDFSRDPMRAYLEFWGVMQAIAIQQDAIFELHWAAIGSYPEIGADSAWSRIREARHACAGHPANRSKGLPAPQRAFMGRMFGSYNCIEYELWDAGTGKTTFPTFNLRQMICDYDLDASVLLEAVLLQIKSKLLERMEA